MTRDYEQDLDEHLERFQRRLPGWAARFLGWLWQPRFHWVRIPLAIVLILGGIVGFLPILGFWMIPLGLLVLSIDLAIVRRQRRRAEVWWGRRNKAKSNGQN